MLFAINPQKSEFFEVPVILFQLRVAYLMDRLRLHQA
jgi:hypothetical protein